MDYLKEIITAIELHDVDKIRDCFRNGIDPNMSFQHRPLIDELTGEYTRSPRFSDCVKAFVDHGLEFQDKPLLAVLLNNSNELDKLLNADRSEISRLYSLRCAYTPLDQVTLMHVCAEFNHIDCAEVLIGHGADINARAGLDEYGFGGHTPIYHTVNQNSNQSAGMMEFLLSHNADLTNTVKGVVWGKSYPWETFIPAVNPINYAMMGLLPQMHRSEKVISSVVSTLLARAFGISYSPPNIPCAYLKSK